MSPTMARLVGVVLLIATIGVVSCQAFSAAPRANLPAISAPMHAAPR